MKLVIEDRDGIYDEDFILYLLDYISLFIKGKYSLEKTLLIEQFINDTDRYKSIFKKYISVRDVIFQASENLEYHIFDGGRIEITISTTCLIPNTYIRLHEMCRLINFGTLDVKGFPIFTNVFEYFKKNINTYYKRYNRSL